MKCFKPLILMGLSTVLLTVGGLAAAAEPSLDEVSATSAAQLTLDNPERDREIAPLEAATTERPAMTEQDVNLMVDGEVRMSLGMRLAQSAPQS